MKSLPNLNLLCKILIARTLIKVIVKIITKIRRFILFVLKILCLERKLIKIVPEIDLREMLDLIMIIIVSELFQSLNSFLSILII